MTTERLIRVLAQPIEKGQCRSGDAPATWRITFPNQKRMPFDGDPVALKTDTVDDEAIECLGQSESHFATCPQSQQWSRRKAAKAVMVLLACSIACASPTAPTSASATLGRGGALTASPVNCNAPFNTSVRYDNPQQVHVTNVSNCDNDFVFAAVDVESHEIYGWDHERIEGSKKDADGREILTLDERGRLLPIYTGKIISWINTAAACGRKIQLDGWVFTTTTGNIREVTY